MFWRIGCLDVFIHARINKRLKAGKRVMAQNVVVYAGHVSLVSALSLPKAKLGFLGRKLSTKFKPTYRRRKYAVKVQELYACSMPSSCACISSCWPGSKMVLMESSNALSFSMVSITSSIEGCGRGSSQRVKPTPPVYSHFAPGRKRCIATLIPTS